MFLIISLSWPQRADAAADGKGIVVAIFAAGFKYVISASTYSLYVLLS